MRNDWYQFRAKALVARGQQTPNENDDQVADAPADPTVAEIYVIDWIGDWIDDMWNRVTGEAMGLTARQFVDDLAALPESVTTLRVHLNSPGGDVQGGINIANALREWGAKPGHAVETIVDGLAASIASVIAMAGTKVTMGDNALLMLHNPWIVSVGDAPALRKDAEILDAMRAQIVATYQWHSSLTSAELIALLDAETWLTADEAIAKGLATHKIEGLKAAATVNAKALARLKVPDQHRARVAALARRPEAPAPTPTPAPATPPPIAAPPAADVLQLCAAAGCLELAQDFVVRGMALDEVRTALAAEQLRKTQAAARADRIRAVCKVAKLPQFADGYIESSMPIERVHEQLTTILGLIDRAAPQIDGSLSPDPGGGPRRTAINPSEIYAQRNAAGTPTR